MDLSTTYMKFELPNPFIVGAGPLADNVASVRRCEDAGAAAIVMRSLFEEQITAEQVATNRSMEEPAESFAEALSYFPNPEEFVLGPDEYLEQLRKTKEAVNVPVIASLNGCTRGGWLDYAKLMQQAGADALELNVYYVGTDPDESGQALEDRTIEMVKAVKDSVTIPVAVKLSPFYASFANMAKRVDETGVDGMVLFNRFYQPDIDVEELEVNSALTLSSPGAIRLRLRWLAILSGRVNASLAMTGGVHDAIGALKGVMCGAHAVQLVSMLLKDGVHKLAFLREGLANWLEEHEYESLRQAQGSMNLLKCPDPKAFERANYMHILQSWQPS
jgi:dihydroorotate dehydrogenase (fumarate)